VNIRTILVPVDFSPHSDRALELAIDLAATLGARLELLHCYRFEMFDVAVYDPPYVASLPKDFDAPVREAATRKLDELARRAADRGIPAVPHIVEMRPTDGILQAASDLSADLIVMGTRGLSGLQHVVLGSVAERTVRLAPCPVLTVKAD
jgi:nucleotide-binding universal stress UspA family protein